MGVANVESQKAPPASKQLVTGIAELLGRDCRVAAAKPTIADAADNRPCPRSRSASTSTRTRIRTSPHHRHPTPPPPRPLRPPRRRRPTHPHHLLLPPRGRPPRPCRRARRMFRP